MMSHAELVMRRKNVRAFIKADSISITFMRRHSPTPSPAGGLVASAPEPLNPQEGRIVLNKRRYTNGLVNAEAGEIPNTDYLLIMEYDKDVKKDDEFIYRGENYKVTGIYGARTESFLCSIDFLGPKNRNV